MTVTSKAKECREKRTRRPRSPSISSCNASNCFVVHARAAISCRGTRTFEDLNCDASKLHSRKILQNRITSSQSAMRQREHSNVHDPVFKRSSCTGLTSQDNEESISPSTKIASNRSSIGFDSTQNKTYQSQEEKSCIIVQPNVKSNFLEDG
jgi:hypothetical protein